MSAAGNTDDSGRRAFRAVAASASGAAARKVCSAWPPLAWGLFGPAAPSGPLPCRVSLFGCCSWQRRPVVSRWWGDVRGGKVPVWRCAGCGLVAAGAVLVGLVFAVLSPLRAGCCSDVWGAWRRAWRVMGLRVIPVLGGAQSRSWWNDTKVGCGVGVRWLMCPSRCRILDVSRRPQSAKPLRSQRGRRPGIGSRRGGFAQPRAPFGDVPDLVGCFAPSANAVNAPVRHLLGGVVSRRSAPLMGEVLPGAEESYAPLLPADTR